MEKSYQVCHECTLGFEESFILSLPLSSMSQIEMHYLFRSEIAGMGGGGGLAAVTKKESIVNMASRSVSSTCYKSLVHSSSYIEITSCVSSSASLLILLQ